MSFDKTEPPEQYLDRVRRSLHKIPEIAYCEFDTQKLIMRELEEMGIPYRTVGTGIIADIDLKKGRTVAFRADMDALPISEKSGAECSSERENMMHACGHDGHMAVLLAFLREAALSRDLLGCNVRGIFQPAEEADGGSLSMIAEGCLKGVDEIFALHVDPSMNEGKLGAEVGGAMAGAYEFDVRFTGTSCHCAERQKGADALLTAAEFAAATQGLTEGLESVINVGRLIGGDARNVVAAHAVAECTFRFFEQGVRDELLSRLHSTADRVSEKYGTSYVIEKRVEYIPVRNNADSVQKIRQAAGDSFVSPGRRYTAEDFAFYLREKPGAMFWLGVSDGKKPPMKLHSEEFFFDSRALIHGVKVFCRLAGLFTDSKE